MSLFPVLNRDRLQAASPQIAKNAVVNELDNITTAVSTWALVQHNEDGTHKVRAAGIDFIPVGGMIRWPLTTPPVGWLNCDGSAISRTAYPLLFKAIGIVSGSGNATTTFNLPNVANFVILAI